MLHETGQLETFPIPFGNGFLKISRKGETWELMKYKYLCSIFNQKFCYPEFLSSFCHFMFFYHLCFIHIAEVSPLFKVKVYLAYFSIASYYWLLECVDCDKHCHDLAFSYWFEVLILFCRDGISKNQSLLTLGMFEVVAWFLAGLKILLASVIVD